jgi:hypothetical protein
LLLDLALELQNQLSLRLADHGKTIDHLIDLYFDNFNSVINILDFKIKNHDIIKELNESLKEKITLIGMVNNYSNYT